MTKPKNRQTPGRRATAARLGFNTSPGALRDKQCRDANAAGESALLSEDSLAEDWLSPAEDEAWRNFQPAS